MTVRRLKGNELINEQNDIQQEPRTLQDKFEKRDAGNLCNSQIQSI
jgi:hypothetical protein